MRKILKWGLISLLLLGAVAIPVGYFAGRHLLSQYLANEIQIADATLRVVNADLTWGFNVRADSLYYQAPGLRVVSGGIIAEANLFGSLFRLSPSADVNIDTVRIYLEEAPEKEKPESGPPAFPDFKIPAVVDIRLKRLEARGDSGLLAAAEGIRLNNPGERSLLLSIDSLFSPLAQDLQPNLRLYVDWQAPDSLELKARIFRGHDSLALSSFMDKTDLLRGEHVLDAQIASSLPYAQNFMDSAEAMPRAHSTQLQVKVRWAETLELLGELQTRVSHFDSTAAYRLSPQKISLNLELKGRSGRVDLISRGEQGERVELSGPISLGAYDSLAHLGAAVERATAALQGRIRGIPLVVGAETVTADIQVTEARLSADSIALALITGERSQLTAQMRRREGEWDGRFQGDIAANERWVKPFIDTSITFTSLRVQGEMQGASIRFSTQAHQVRAYQVSADSLHAVHRYAGSRYELLSSSLYSGENEFNLAGYVETQPGLSLEFTLHHPEHGSARYYMPSGDAMEAEVDNLLLAEIPYVYLQDLPVAAPRATGIFRWNMLTQAGDVDLRAEAVFRKRKIMAEVSGDWDADSLRVSEAFVRQGESGLKASLLVALGGRQFYDLAGLGLDEFRRVEVSTDGFDLRQALELATEEESDQTRGRLEGGLAYGSESGFTGELRIVGLQHKSLPEGLRVEELKVVGLQDTLLVLVRTDSEKEALLRDSLTVAVTGVMDSVQSITARAMVGERLTARFDGLTHQFKDIQGDLNVQGDVDLPEGSGKIVDLDLRARLDIPFKDALAAMRIDVESLRGTYAVPDLDTQYFEVAASVREGIASVPDLRIHNAAGDTLRGSARYDVSGGKGLRVDLKGESFAGAVQGGTRFRLRDLEAQLHLDSLAMRVTAKVGNASLNVTQPPTRISGRVRDISLDYRSPMQMRAPPTNGGVNGRRRDAILQVEPAVLNLSATLDSSLIRYRLRSIEALQGLFRKRSSRPTRQAGPEEASRPMQVRINIQTEGTENRIDTDILRMNMVGDVNIQGIWPYALVRGRISAVSGEMGLEKQSYDINQLEVLWQNSPLEEGRMTMESQKNLARTCERNEQDSCLVYTRLGGSLEDLQFSYETDCGGSFGAGADVTALLLSVHRGCYDDSFAAGGTGASLGSRALTLLEAPVSQELSRLLSRYSGSWIASTQISGLGALTQAGGESQEAVGDSAQAVSVEIISKEILRTRFRARAGYNPGENVHNPWEQMVGLEWRPPLAGLARSNAWKRRLRDNVSVLAAIERDPSLETNPNEEVLQRKVSLDYNYNFWNFWFLK